ncbi:pyruvate kinase [Pyrus ussuriensis x Pyrus communis]|uniref:Pyruvate kinase n=1 Tax=Pyrus ussuriensis x Pyrus communis TaxID=2448454 RepID=A0A5N5GDK3_9ROSA|nr:pyruvate kinase [Pyrus ussuriensis x Pyrus communis]
MWLASTSRTAKLVANGFKAVMSLVLKKGGSTAKLVATPARHDLVYCGVLPLLPSAPVRASHAKSTEESIQFAVEFAKAKGLCKLGDAVVALHGANADMIKICFVGKLAGIVELLEKENGEEDVGWHCKNSGSPNSNYKAWLWFWEGVSAGGVGESG